MLELSSRKTRPPVHENSAPDSNDHPTPSLAESSNPTTMEEQGADLISKDITLVRTDRVFNQKELSEFDRQSVESLKRRDEAYSSILNCYQNYAQKILERNPRRQTWFFWSSMAILILSPIQFLGCLIFLRDSANIAALLASAAEVIGALLVFPKIIAEYLFNTNETTSINSIVAAIQNYDISIRSGIRHTVENHYDRDSEI